MLGPSSRRTRGLKGGGNGERFGHGLFVVVASRVLLLVVLFLVMKRIYFFRFVAGRKRKKKLKYNLESGQVFYICMDDSVPLERGERYGETTCIIDALPLCGLGLWVEVGGLFIRG